MLDFNFFEFSDSQVEFLKNYSPKDKFQTSTSEIKQIISKLKLDGNTTEVIRCKRNSVVRLYSELEKNEESFEEGKLIRSENFYKLHNAMMSVTAVCDYYIYKK